MLDYSKNTTIFQIKFRLMLAHLYYELRYSMVLSSNPKAPTLALPHTYIKKRKEKSKMGCIKCRHTSFPLGLMIPFLVSALNIKRGIYLIF